MKAKFQDVILQKIPQEENRKANELARMANAYAHWVEEDTVAHIELIAQINQPLILELNQGEEHDWREVIVAFLKKHNLPKHSRQTQQIK